MVTRKLRKSPKARKAARAGKALDLEQMTLDLVGIRAAVTCAAVQLQHHVADDARVATTLHRAALGPLDALIDAVRPSAAKAVRP